MKSAVIYARVSSIGDRQSTDRQVVDLKDYALKNEFQIIETFQEHVSGAKRNHERPVLTDCISYCKDFQIDTLLLSELSRLGRNTVEVLKSLDELHENRTNVYIQNLSLNTLLEDKAINPLASLITVVLAEMYKIERTNIEYRLRSGRQNYIANGGQLGRKKGTVKSIEIKKDEYREVISLLRKGYAIRKVAKLTDVGISTVQRVKKEFCKD